MKRAGRILVMIGAAISLLVCVAVCVLWVRGEWIGRDEVEWRYNRYLADKSAAATRIALTSDDRRLRWNISWGWVGPYNGNLVYGYYLNADSSRGKPEFSFRHMPNRPAPNAGTWAALFNYNPDSDTTGWGPVRWRYFTRYAPPPGEDFKLIRFDISHWLAALLLAIPPALWFTRYRKATHAARAGLCPICGYDLRATPERCPECGRETRSHPAALT